MADLTVADLTVAELTMADDLITGRRTFISEQFLGSPTLVVSEDGGNVIVGRKIIDDEFKMQTLRTYLYVEEEQ
jgi:hypothetical protein